MTRAEIANKGRELFEAGEIDLDETWRFQHPDGRLMIDVNGNFAPPNPNERLDFLAETRKAMMLMEERGDATASSQHYQTMSELMAKLERWQADGIPS